MFWGVAVESGKKYSQIVETSYHLSMAALEPSNKKISDSNKYVSLMLEHSKTEFLLCTLEYNRVMQVKLDLMFVEGEEVTFYLNGEGIVHLTGYVIDEDDEVSESEGSATEEVAQVTRKNKNQFKSYANDKADSDSDSDDDAEDESYSPKAMPIAMKRKSEDQAVSSSKKPKTPNSSKINSTAAQPNIEQNSSKKNRSAQGKLPYLEAGLESDDDDDDEDDEDDEDFDIEDIDVLKEESDDDDDSSDDNEEDDDENGGWGKSWNKSKPSVNVSQTKGKGNKSPQAVIKPVKNQKQSPNANKNQSPVAKQQHTTNNGKQNQTPGNKNQGGNNSFNRTPGSKKKQQVNKQKKQF